MDKLLVIMKNGDIYFYKCFLDEETYKNISTDLRKYLIQIEYGDKVDKYSLNEDAIISICINKQIEEFKAFMNKYLYNIFPDTLLNRVNEINEKLNSVRLELGTTTVLMKILQGDLSFLDKDDKISKIIEVYEDNKTGEFYKKDSFKVIKHLTEKSVNIEFPYCESNETINIEFKHEIKLRYYQEQAYNQLAGKKSGMLIMPIASGKNYIAIKLIANIKKKTLILCEHKNNCKIWRRDLNTLLHLDDKRVVVVEDKRFEAEEITICSYDLIRKDNGVLENLNSIKWGAIIYDNAHKAVTDKTIDSLYLSTEYRYALASTLNRSDDEVSSLVKLFRVSTYTITSKELTNNLFQKTFKGYKIDFRGNSISKGELVRKIINSKELERLVIVAHKVKDIKDISRKLNIPFINESTSEYERRIIVNRFESNKDNILCISNLIENYRISNFNSMIAAGYRGKTLIEEDFRIGTLIGTQEKLEEEVISKYYYLITDDKEKENVEKKIRLLKANYGFTFENLEIN